MRTFALTLAVAVLSFTGSLHASTLLTENFDELTGALGVVSAGAFSTINGTNVDIVGAANGWGALCVGAESGNCIDMDGSGGNPLGQLQSNMIFNAGTYLLSFDLIGNQRAGSSSTTVNFGNYSQTFNLGFSNDIAGIIANQQVTLFTPGYLRFISNDSAGDQQGNLLDNVSVFTAPAATPEPASLFLLGTALCAGMGFLALRSRPIGSGK